MLSGTYMTLLNTIANIGTKWPQTFALWLVDVISWKRCIFENGTNSTLSHLNFLDNKCEDKIAKNICISNGGHCHIDIDGYYIEGIFSVIYGIIFYFISKRVIEYLEKLPLDDWHILTKKINNAESVRLNRSEIIKEEKL